MTDQEHVVTYEAGHTEAGFGVHDDPKKQQYQIPLTYDVRSRRLLLFIVAAVVGALLCTVIALTVAYFQSRNDVHELQTKVNCGDELTANFSLTLARTVGQIGGGVETLEGGLYEAFITNNDAALAELMAAVPQQREDIKESTAELIAAANKRQDELKEC